VTTAPPRSGGRFAFSYPQLHESTFEATHAGFAQTFAGMMHNPSAFTLWLRAGADPRLLNPGGVFMKHINIRTIDSTQEDSQIEGRLPYTWVKTYHPEWVLRDVFNNPVRLFLPTEEALDFGNPALLDYVMNTWLPQYVMDSTDSDPARVTWFMQDEGVFTRMFINCGAGDTVCERYNSNEGVQSAWEAFLDAFHARWPNKRMAINTGPLDYVPTHDQMAFFTRVMSKADGYYSESLTNDGTYWDVDPNDSKRTALLTTMAFASWLADSNKVFFPNIGVTMAEEPTQTQVDYAWAFFNLMRRGDLQMFSVITKMGRQWIPRHYPEMDLDLGAPIENATEVYPNVWRRQFTNAIAYVNFSDGPVSIELPPGAFRTSVGATVTSPMTLGSFAGLTVYQSN
jgi:hypothetical protein